MIGAQKTFSGQPLTACSMLTALPVRFVAKTRSSAGVSRISANSSARHAGTTALSKTSARLAQNTCFSLSAAAVRRYQERGLFHVEAAVCPPPRTHAQMSGAQRLRMASIASWRDLRASDLRIEGVVGPLDFRCSLPCPLASRIYPTPLDQQRRRSRNARLAACLESSRISRQLRGKFVEAPDYLIAIIALEHADGDQRSD
jgi:hypothetical protein